MRPIDRRAHGAAFLCLTLLMCASVGVSSTGLCIASILGAKPAAADCEKICTRLECPMHRRSRQPEADAARTTDALSTSECRIHAGTVPAQLAQLGLTLQCLPPSVFEAAHVEPISAIASVAQPTRSVEKGPDPLPPRACLGIS